MILISIKFLNQSIENGGVGLDKTLPDEVNIKPMFFHSILLFFQYKP